MADKGGDEKNNPFSFKNFVSEQDKKLNLDEEDPDDIFGLSKPKPRRTDKLRVEANSNSADKVKKKKDKPKENPFSFKKFLSASPIQNLGKCDQNPEAPPDIASDVPSFINDHYTGIASYKSPVLPVSDDDFDCKAAAKDICPNNSRDNNPRLESSELPENLLSVAHGGAASQSCNDSIINDDIKSQENVFPRDQSDRSLSSGISLGLPDFLSDGAILGGRSYTDQRSHKTLDDDLHGQIRIIQEENERLRNELSREKQKCSEKNQKLSQMKIDLERQRKKEAEDTAVMEKAVMQVEENLVSTTKRAVQAESNVAKLKHEVKSLQVQVLSLTSEMEALKSGDAGLADLRERTKYSAEQLKDAAILAENHLKELSAGVDKIKLAALVLSSLEKVSDFKHNESEESESKPP